MFGPTREPSLTIPINFPFQLLLNFSYTRSLVFFSLDTPLIHDFIIILFPEVPSIRDSPLQRHNSHQHPLSSTESPQP
jgi:hypothetical protein